MAGQPTAEQANDEGQRQRQRQSQSYSRRAPAEELFDVGAIGCRAGQNKITQQDLPISLLSDMVGKIVQVGLVGEKGEELRMPGECGRRKLDQVARTHARTHRNGSGGPGTGLGAGRKGFNDRVLVEEGPKTDGLHSRVDYCYLTV